MRSAICLIKLLCMYVCKFKVQTLKLSLCISYYDHIIIVDLKRKNRLKVGTDASFYSPGGSTFLREMT